MKKIVLTVMATLLLASTAFAGPKAPKKTDALLKKGKAAFTTNCVACHGDKGLGDGPAAVALNPKPRSFVNDKFKQGDKPAQVFETISKGIAGTPMIGYGHLSEEDRWGLVYHVLSFRKADKKTKKGKK